MPHQHADVDGLGPESHSSSFTDEALILPTSSTVERRIPGERDTCRICRGEGTQAEPLFYPCRCSGSIKFVHQECLMDWLSHSNKKHCELCKRPYRFTKLYDPHMPETLPAPIFVRRLLARSIASLVTWLRVLLVGGVWLAWFPWSMRACLQLLFWLADGGWAPWETHNAQLSTPQRALAVASEFSRSLKLSPISLQTDAPLVSPSSRASSGAPASGDSSSVVEMFLRTFRQSFRRSSPRLMFDRLLAGLGLNTGKPLATSPSAPGIDSLNHLSKQGIRQSSLLSNFPFLSHMTASPALNKVIIDIMEGQVITLLMVMAFLLIFLMREGLVQHQLGVNLGGDLIGEPEPRPEPENVNVEAEADEAQLGPDPSADTEGGTQGPESVGDAHEDSSMGPLADDTDGSAHSADEVPQVGGSTLVERRTFSSGSSTDDNATGASTGVATHSDIMPNHNNDDQDSPAQLGSRAGFSDSRDLSQTRSRSHPRRPRLHPRNASSTAALIHRIIEEDDLSQEENSPPREIVELWHRANRNKDELLRIVRDESQTAELRGVINALKEIQEQDQTDDIKIEMDMHGIDSSAVSANPRDKGETRINYNEHEASETTAYSPRRKRSRGFASDKGKRKAADNFPRSDTDSDTGSHDFIDVLQRPGSDENVIPEEPARRISSKTSDRSNGSYPHVVEPITHRPSEWDTSTRFAGSDDGTDPPSQGRSRTSSMEGEAHTGSSASLGNQVGDVNVERPQNGYADPPSQNAQDDRVATQLPQTGWRGTFHSIRDWLWGNVDLDQHADGGVLDNDRRLRLNHALGPRPNPAAVEQGNADEEPIAAAANEEDDADGEEPMFPAPGMEDVEAVEDAEDVDGIMELAGLRGPITGLFQSAMFGLVLSSTALYCGIWIPYLWGKIVLVFFAHPLAVLNTPLQLFLAFSELITDLAIIFSWSFIHGVDHVVRLFLALIAPSNSFVAKYAHNTAIANSSRSISDKALDRIARIIFQPSFKISVMDYPIFSVASYEALQSLKDVVRDTLGYTSRLLESFQQCEARSLLSSMHRWLLQSTGRLARFATNRGFREGLILWPRDLIHLIFSLGKTKSLTPTVEAPGRTDTIGATPVIWTTTDRFLVIIVGYAMFSLIGAMYVKRGTTFSTSEQGKRVEGIIRTLLVQAGGILKGILIISIEMLVFPLYCGLLLDLALLPLFDQATFSSRMGFTINSPWTSAFVHWFIGTCYMFHFALFVSMCRKILRPGVLYFIRDPDDPTFHPIRDVLERSITSQLRKIAFSALVYGALVIFCLGSVVWGLKYAMEGIFPIYWSSDEPILEFPVDLLVYSFLMPLTAKFLRLSDGFHMLCTWCFRKCARTLRLTWFLFGERRADEEGHHVRRTLAAILFRRKGDIQNPTVVQDGQSVPKNADVEAYFLKDGRFVRTPGSDQVRIPKGGMTFLAAEEADDEAWARRMLSRDGVDDTLKAYTKVYVPPGFKVRISLFVLFVWIFAATAGVSITVIPLVLGRSIFAGLFPNHLRMNDVYAFSIGVYILGALFYSAVHYRRGIALAKYFFQLHVGSPTQMVQRAYEFGLRSASLLYAITAFFVILPGLLAFLVELYIVIPIHSYLAPDQVHVIHLVQDWTLGVLYVKIAGRWILWYSHLRPARALRAIIRNGWLRPDVRLATRFFILPAVVLLGFAVVLPLPFAWMALKLHVHKLVGLSESQVYRYSYPVALAAGVAAGLVYLFSLAVHRWRQTIRDEVYLVGEVLHNLGESRATTRA